MADFELEDKSGNRYRIRKGAGPKFWHPENLGAGSSLLADNLLSAMPANGLQQAHNHFYFGTLHDIPNLPNGPQAALSTALSNSYLTIEKIGTALAINDDEPDPRNELRVKIRNALMAIVAGERAEAAMYQKQMDKETTVMKGVIYTGAFMQGVGSSAWGMVVWLKEVSDVVNPFVKMQHAARALQAAWESDDFSKTYSETYVKGEKRELVEALGFDPTQITEQQIDEAMAMANLVIEDPSLRDMLYQFVKDYAEAQHAIEITNVAGTAAFELILTIIMAAVTGGVGAVAAIGSKAHLIKKFQKVGDLLSDFAKATRKLKLEGKKRKAKGNSAKFSDMEADQVQAKKTDAHGAETGEVSKPAPKPATNQKNQTLTVHDTAVANHKKDYEIKRDQAIANGESKRTIGAYKARVTEAKGEAAASDYMTKNHPDAEMVQGFSKGSGFDQVWVKRAPDGSIEEYIVVEAKGPGAKLAIKGGKGPQMSQQWVDNTNIEMTTSKNPEISQLGKDLTDAIDYGPPPKVSGLGLEAVEKNGVVTGAKEITLPNGTAFN